MGKYKYIHYIGEQFYIETEIHFEEEGEKQGECAAETSADLENLRQRKKVSSFCMGPNSACDAPLVDSDSESLMVLTAWQKYV